MAQRFPFRDIFEEDSNGSLISKRTIEVNSVRITPGIVFQKGVFLSGIDFQLYKYWDNMLIIRGEKVDGN